jgi:hypothetical protein
VPLFEDKTAGSGVDITYRNGEEALHYAIVESLGGGLGVIDYDNDGLLDIVVCGGGYFDGPDKKQIKGLPNRLYKNMGNWKFKDVTKEVGIDQPLFYSHGVAVGDYDNDGFPDLLITGYGRCALFHNVPDGKGGRKFVEVTKEAGLLGKHFWSTSAAFADLDGDGYPELYLCQYVDWSWKNHPKCPGYNSKVKQDVCPPKSFHSVEHALFQNDGKGHFINVTRSSGIRVDRRGEVKGLEDALQRWLEEKKIVPDELEAEITRLTDKIAKSKNTDPGLKDLQARLEKLRPLDAELKGRKDQIEQFKSDDFGKGLGLVIVDLNKDRKPDIYIANDTTDNFLYVNRSKPGRLRFEEVGMETGTAKDDRGAANGSMGVDAGDFNGTGLASLWVTNYEGELHALYVNKLRERLYFSFGTYQSGISAIGQLFVGFGTGFLDTDNDGWLDIFISNGHVVKHPYPAPLRQKPVLFANQGEGRFKEIGERGGAYFRTGHIGRGVAIADLDNDGYPDLIISHIQEPVAILRNTAQAKNHWVGVRLIGKDHRDVVGTKLTMNVNGRKLTRFAMGGRSYLSACDTRILFGLGQAQQAGRLTVEWPTGSPLVEHFDDLAIDQYHKIVQGEGKQ